jgi:glycosyltransferase involved in cell wall biosynthesis
MSIKYFLFFIFLQSFLNAENSKKTVCLNMIVKDEAQVITRCLSSVKPLIDYWVIVDTGSTDNTQQIIKEYMQAIPGELHERPWVNFAHNRNEALILAKSKADYILIIDADEILSFPKDYTLPFLDQDCYYITTKYNGTEYVRKQLIQSKLDWIWVGKVHEVLVSSQARTSGNLESVINSVHTDGARAKDPLRFSKDAKLLEGAVKENPNDTRSLYYLAQSYRDAGDIDLAIKNYQKRADLGGWDQEVFWSLYQIATLQEKLKQPYETVVKSYLKAIAYRPLRIEPMFRLATYYRNHGDFLLAYLLAGYALKMPLSKDTFQETWVRDFGLLLEYSTAAFYAGKYEDCLESCKKLLANPKTPLDTRADIEKNLPFIYAEMNKSS